MELKEQIEEYYKNNKIFLHKLFSDNEQMINGRICHSSIIILYILSQFITINKYLEIGVHNGGSISMLLSNTHLESDIYGIDLFEDMYNKDKHYNYTKFNKYQYFKRDKLLELKTTKNITVLKNHYNNRSNVKFIKGNSYFDDTEITFKNLLNDNLIDVLFIDGDHTLDGIQNDYNRYSKYVKKNGFIIFDDYHHEEIKKFVDLLLKDSSLKLITKFKSDTSNAIDVIIQKL